MSDKQISDHDLEIELNLKVPAPLDPHIASISIRTGSNNPADYFDLLLSASFGSEYVKIGSGDDIIEVKISIQKAEIKLNSASCSFALIHNVDTHSENWQLTERAAKKHGRAAERKVGGNLGLSREGFAGDLGAAANKSRSSENSSEHERNRNILPYRVLSDDTIQVGYADDFELDIHGRVIDESIGIRVVPTHLDQSIGVLARTRVRERWITIDEANPIKATSTFRRLWRKMENRSPDAKRKRDLFGKLIAHLIAKDLQERDDDVHATLCAAAVVFSPSSSQTRSIGSSPREGRITIDPTLIEKFLQADRAMELEILQTAGVDLDYAPVAPSPVSAFVEFWNAQYEDFRPHIPKALGRDFFQRAAEGSLGITSRVVLESDVNAKDYLSPTGVQEPLSAQELIDSCKGHWFALAALIGVLALVKGDRAYEIARIMGFRKSYQTMQRRIRPYAVKSELGYLVSVSDLMRAIEYNDFSYRLLGERLYLPSILLFGDGELDQMTGQILD